MSTKFTISKTKRRKYVPIVGWASLCVECETKEEAEKWARIFVEMLELDPDRLDRDYTLKRTKSGQLR